MHKDSSLGVFLKKTLYPELYRELDRVFEEFGFAPRQGYWEATTGSHTKTLPESPKPSNVRCYENLPFGFDISGGPFISWVSYPHEKDDIAAEEFLEKIKHLAEVLGLNMPEFSPSQEHVEAVSLEEASAVTLSTVLLCCSERLLAAEDGEAWDYLLSNKGINREEVKLLGFGLYPSISEIKKTLKTKGLSQEFIKNSGLINKRFEGCLTIPWMDEYGRPIDICGIKNNSYRASALLDKGWKRCPLFYDRARQEDHTALVLVTDPVDAALLQARGDPRVVACISNEYIQQQTKTLSNYDVSSITLCLDADSRSDTQACISSLYKAGINVFIARTLADEMDICQFISQEGMSAWKSHIDDAYHAYTFRAQSIIEKHKPLDSEWTDRAQACYLDDAIAFDLKLSGPRRHTDMKPYFWDVILYATGLEWEAVEKRLQYQREQQKEKQEIKKHTSVIEKTHKLLRSGNLGGAKTYLREKTKTLWTSETLGQQEPVSSIAEELKEHENRLSKWRERPEKLIGLPQKTLPALDRATLGLRDLMLLAGGPNIGKTALAVQLGLDVVANNPDACFLFVSLEMSRWDILSRIRCYLARLDWKTLVFGSQSNSSPEINLCFSQEELQRLQEADRQIDEWGNRVRILDERNFPSPTSESILSQLEHLKKQTNAERALLLIDYLQVFPIPKSESRNIRSDLDADRWRIGEMKRLRDYAQDDAILVISEARKPTQKQGQGKEKEDWGGELADVMGSARGSYTPDMVFLLNAKTENEKEPSRTKLKIVKGRDGVTKTALELIFWYTQSRFEENIGSLAD